MKIKSPATGVTSSALGRWMFAPVERPSFTDALKFPDDVTRLDSSQVSMLHGRYTSLLAYAMSELAKVDVEALHCRSDCMVHKANIMRTGHTYGRKKNVIDLSVRLDKKMEELELAAHRIEEKQIMLKSYVEIFDRYINALSREMSRRQAEINKA